MKKASKRRGSGKQAKELAALARLPDKEIDLSDIPEIRDGQGQLPKAGGTKRKTEWPD